MKLTATYALIALLTFGYAASNQAGCNFPKHHNGKTACQATGGLVAAFLWPLYWTWEAFDAGRAALAKEDA